MSGQSKRSGKSNVEVTPSQINKYDIFTNEKNISIERNKRFSTVRKAIKSDNDTDNDGRVNLDQFKNVVK